jgi:D-3-phosphoglycerate dehydrogenase
VNTEALVKHLKSGKIKGAALDVLEYENYSFENIENQNIPNAFKYLIEADNVVLSPHIAGWSHESAQKMAEVIVEKIKAIYSSNL